MEKARLSRPVTVAGQKYILSRTKGEKGGKAGGLWFTLVSSLSKTLNFNFVNKM